MGAYVLALPDLDNFLFEDEENWELAGEETTREQVDDDDVDDEERDEIIDDDREAANEPFRFNATHDDEAPDALASES